MNATVQPPQSRLDWILRLIVGTVFVVAGMLKIADPAKFAVDVSHYRLVPPGLLNLVAILVPWIEFTAGVFVLAGVWLRAAARIVTGLTMIFFCLIVSALARGLNIECGCFGTLGGQHVGLVHLAIDAVLFFLAALLARPSGDRPAQSFRREAGANVKKTFPFWERGRPRPQQCPDSPALPSCGQSILTGEAAAGHGPAFRLRFKDTPKNE